MAFVVEDGTGLSNANSYLSVADLDAYMADRGLTFSGSPTDTDKEQWLVLATDYVEKVFSTCFLGQKSSSTQRLSWPRQYAYDELGTAVGDDEVPADLERAVAEYAIRQATADLLPDPEVDDSGAQVKMASAGPLTVEYFPGTTTVNYRPYPAADGYLRKLTGGGGRRVYR